MSHYSPRSPGSRRRERTAYAWVLLPEDSVQPPDLQRQQCAGGVTLDVEFDRAAAHFAIFHVGWLVGRQVDACLQPLAAIRAAHGDEFLRRQPRGPLPRLPHRLESVELVDALPVEARDAPAQALELGRCAAFGHLRVDVTKAMLHSWASGQRGYDNMPTVRGTLVLLCAAAALLCGCAGPRVEEAPAPGVNLAGTWKLDHAASDDPQKILDHMR